MIASLAGASLAEILYINQSIRSKAPLKTVRLLGNLVSDVAIRFNISDSFSSEVLGEFF